MHSKSILFINYLYIHSNYSRFAMYSDVQPIYTVWWFKFVTKCCIKYNLYAYVIYHKMHQYNVVLKVKIFHKISSQTAGN